jgi:Zn-finger in ubiquitin-hydrolases and other protein
MAADTCVHLDQVQDVSPSANGCEDCLAIGAQWVHLRMCMICGHVGCCDNSPNRHATKHFHAVGHPLIQSFEPDEEWWWCFVDELAFELDGAPSFSHS